MAFFRLATTLVTPAIATLITSFATALVMAMAVTTAIAKTAVIVTWSTVIAWSAIAGLVFAAFAVAWTELAALTTLVRAAKATILRTVTEVTALRTLVTAVIETVAGRAIAWSAIAGRAIARLIFAAFAITGTELAALTTLVRAAKAAATGTIAKVAGLGTLVTTVFETVTWSAIAGPAAAGLILAALPPLVGTPKATALWTVTKVTPLRALVTAVIETVAWSAATGLVFATLAVALTFTTVFTVGLESAIATAKAAFAPLGRTIIAIKAGAALAVITAWTAIGAAKARRTRPFVTFTLGAGTAIAARAAIRAVAAGRPGAARSGFFRRGRLGRCTQNRARRRGVGRRGGIASTWGAGLFRRID